jgi:hypothetical protein
VNYIWVVAYRPSHHAPEFVIDSIYDSEIAAWRGLDELKNTQLSRNYADMQVARFQRKKSRFWAWIRLLFGRAKLLTR